MEIFEHKTHSTLVPVWKSLGMAQAMLEIQNTFAPLLGLEKNIAFVAQHSVRVVWEVPKVMVVVVLLLGIVRCHIIWIKKWNEMKKKNKVLWYQLILSTTIICSLALFYTEIFEFEIVVAIVRICMVHPYVIFDYKWVLLGDLICCM